MDARLIVLFLILSRWAGQLVLGWLNRCSVQAHAGGIPEAFRETLDGETYRKSVAYTLEKNRLALWQDSWDTLILLLFLFSGLLPWLHGTHRAVLGSSLPAQTLFLLEVGLLFALADIPWGWYSQFNLEERFGFNTTTKKLWWTDLGKEFLLSMGIGFPLLLALLALVRWSGPTWWLWAWAGTFLVQVILMVVVPVWILPWFFKFTPLPEGALRERLLRLAERAGFRHAGLQVMDGSRRSRHSNAFFTGLGRFRKIILFDTLLQQLSEEEAEAVLAHEIGHDRMGHIRRMLVLSLVGSLLAFRLLDWISSQKWLYSSFGFSEPDMAIALLLFALLANTVSFWWSPVSNWLSRRFEYQADAFAAGCIADSNAMIRALRILNRENLSNLTPHPAYSFFYYSHPTLLERERALEKRSGQP